METLFCMRYRFLIGLAALSAAFPLETARLSAADPSPAPPGVALSPEEEDWQRLLISISATAVPASSKRSFTQYQSDRVQAALKSRSISNSAQAFYQSYPNSARAALARKFEALEALLGVTDSDATQEQSAQRIAAGYRGDTANAASDRFEIGVLAERIAIRTKLNGTPFGENGTELLKVADKLRKEFGDIPEVFDYYASVARGADMALAAQIATNLNKWPAGSAAKAEAQAILERNALLDRPLPVSLRTVHGDVFDLSKQNGKLTVIYVFRPEGRNGMALFSYKNLFPSDAQVVYLALGLPASKVASLASKAPMSGIFCVEPDGPSAASVALLRVRRTPYVFVIARTGKLVGFGPRSELPNLLAANSR